LSYRPAADADWQTALIEQAAHVDSARAALAPGGRYFVLCFSDQQPGAGGPQQLTRGYRTVRPT
jgi:hypothetical protein